MSRRELFFAILAITLTTLLTYGVMMTQLGFYRDDWYLVWTAQTQGTQGMLSLFAGDRPFDGWLYAFDFWLVGISPLAWQVYSLLVKLSSALAFLWLLRSVWENRKLETTFITLLFVVYPGYFQQPNALMTKQLLLSGALAILSLALTVNAVKATQMSRKILLTALAALTSALYMLIYEALVGYEVARALLLLYLFLKENKDWKQAVKSAFWNILPYLFFMASFLFWRLFIFDAKRKSTDVGNIAGNYTSAHGFIGFAIEYVKDLIETTILAWGVPLYQFWNQAIYKEMGQAAVVALGALLLVTGYYLLTRKHSTVEENAEDTSARDWMILGALFIAVTTLPIVAAGRNVIFGVQWDRYTYQSIFGVALFVGGFAFYAVKGKTRWALLTFLLVSGVMTQIFSANFYRAFWKVERELWWQLTWRAPQIEDGANLIVSLPSGYALAEEYEVWGPANMVYHPQSPDVIISGQIMFGDVWLDFARGTQEDRTVRGTIKVTRDYGQSIVIAQPSPYSCIHVLDSRRFEQAVNERVDVSLIAKYSDVSLIHNSKDLAVPLVEVFGDEPVHGWCYYYQKMDLARQMNDWQTAADFADEAIKLGLEPRDASEWLPALEAYVHVNNEKSAKRVTSLIKIDPTAYRSLCARYKDLRDAPADYDRAALSEALCVKYK
jgi:hypothetical protein